MADVLYIHGLGHFHPDTVIDNAFLESLAIGTSNDWILERVGIRERRTVLPLQYIADTKNADVRAADEAASLSSLDMAIAAASLALKRSGIRASQIGLVVAGGCVPSMNLPSEANRIARAMGLNVPAFDLNAGCASFGAQLHWLRLARAGLPEFVLIVNSEATTRVVDYRDRSAAVLWGDGAAAAIISSSVPASVRVTESGCGGDSSGADLIEIPRFGHFRQQGSLVQRFAIKTMQGCLARSVDRLRSRASTNASIYFVGHQANGTALERVAASAALEGSQQLQHVALFGNTGAAGAPSVLSQNWGALVPGVGVALAVVGAGLSFAWLELEVS
jgi:3-oxoacyl-[acyl-carrier-protein] synthase-3